MNRTKQIILIMLLLSVLTLTMNSRVIAGSSGKFTEKLADKVVSFKDEGEKYYDTSTLGSFSLSDTFFAGDPIDPAALDMDTVVLITIGDWKFEAMLGDDPKYTQGKTSAMFILTHEESKYNPKTDEETVKDVKHGTVKVKFTNKGMAVNVSASTGYDVKKDVEYSESPFAANFAGENGPINKEMTIGISVDNNEDGWTTDRIYSVVGQGMLKNKMVGKGEDAEEWELASVSVTGTANNKVTIDWNEYLNFEVGRRWRYQTTASEGTYSEYIKETTTKNNFDVYVLGWSSNWSGWLDYWNFGDDGMYRIGCYDDEDQMIDLFLSPPYRMPNAVQLGKEYTQTCKLGNKTVKMKTTFELVNGVTVPYGTFNEVIKVTFKAFGETYIDWYAKGIGHIMEFKDSSNRTDELIAISDSPIRPPN